MRGFLTFGYIASKASELLLEGCKLAFWNIEVITDYVLFFTGEKLFSENLNPKAFPTYALLKYENRYVTHKPLYKNFSIFHHELRIVSYFINSAESSTI